MSWMAVARKEFSDAIRSLVLWIVTTLFVLFGLLMAGVFVLIEDELQSGGEAPGVTVEVLDFVMSPIGLFVPIIALLLGYKAVVGERDAGTLKVLLGLPHTRMDVMLGKFVGRTAVLGVPVLLAFLTMGLIISAAVALVDVGDFALMALLSVVFGAAFLSMAIAVSSAVRSSTAAGALAFGIYILFIMLWDTLLLGLLWAVEGRLPFGAEGFQDIPIWYNVVEMLAPNGAFTIASAGLVPGLDHPQGYFPADPPAYLSPWAALTVLVLWALVPFLLAYARFARADL